MTGDDKAHRVVRLYPDDCQPRSIAPLAPGGAFSGASLWQLDTPRGPLCLRRWPQGHPNQQRLEFIQAVLWHVDQEGFHDIPLPLETRHRHGYVWHEGHLWELTPWLAGKADYRDCPNAAKLSNALGALARFHQAAASFPLPEPGPSQSAGIAERLERLQTLLGGGMAELRGAVDPRVWPELAARTGELFAFVATIGPRVLPLLQTAAHLKIALQPCIRDVWHAHVLFVGDEVSGIVDFGSLRPENVAADVARLLGSLALDDQDDWHTGLGAYQSIRRLTSDELTLVRAFDRSTVLMGGIQWLEWIYLEGRQFADRSAVLSRIDEFLSRLRNLSQTLP